MRSGKGIFTDYVSSWIFENFTAKKTLSVWQFFFFIQKRLQNKT